MYKISYDFSSVQCDFPPDIAEKVFNWGKKNIPDSIIAIKPGNGHFGREDEIHITVKYGIHTVDFTKVQALLNSIKPFEIVLGNISQFEADDHDVIKIDVASPQLFDLNKALTKNFENSDSHPDYIPHVTLAYVKKGEGKKYIGRKDFRGVRVPIDNVTFSGKDNRMTRLNIASEKEERWPPIIAVDFDGSIVLTNEDVMSKNFQLKPYAKEAINWLIDNGCYVIIWTVRSGEAQNIMKTFLDTVGIKYHAINKNAPFVNFPTSEKIFFSYCVDDRAQKESIDWKKELKYIRDVVINR